MVVSSNPSFKYKKTINEKVITLNDVFERIKKSNSNIQLMIDAKGNISKELIPLIKQYPELREKLIICSPDIKFLEKFKERLPGCRIGLSLNSTAHDLFRRMTINDLKIAKKLGVESVQPLFSKFSREMLVECYKSGILVRAWGVNSKKAMRRMVSWGVHGIITDYPCTLKKEIEKMKQNPKRRIVPRRDCSYRVLPPIKGKSTRQIN